MKIDSEIIKMKESTTKMSLTIKTVPINKAYAFNFAMIPKYQC